MSVADAEPIATESVVDSAARWLLRFGIDQAGHLELTALWDIAVRAAVSADLQRSGRLVETDTQVEVDLEADGFAYEDEACDALASGECADLAEWIRHGRFRARAVAAELVDDGEWRRRWAPIVPGGVRYRARSQQHAAARRRIAHVHDGEIGPADDAEAAVAVLGHALNVVRPKGIGRRRPAADPLTASGCGALAALVDVAVVEIAASAAAARTNSNPTW